MWFWCLIRPVLFTVVSSHGKAHSYKNPKASKAITVHTAEHRWVGCEISLKTPHRSSLTDLLCFNKKNPLHLIFPPNYFLPLFNLCFSPLGCCVWQEGVNAPWKQMTQPCALVCCNLSHFHMGSSLKTHTHPREIRWTRSLIQSHTDLQRAELKSWTYRCFTSSKSDYTCALVYRTDTSLMYGGLHDLHKNKRFHREARGGGRRSEGPSPSGSLLKEAHPSALESSLRKFDNLK